MVTTRERVKDLAAFEESTARCRELERLSTPAGVALLDSLGVHGPAADLERLVEDVSGHALTLTLLGGYLAAPTAATCAGATWWASRRPTRRSRAATPSG